MSMQKLFGTDGIRAEANTFPMTGEVAMRVGRALVWAIKNAHKDWGYLASDAAALSARSKRIKIVIGKDTRRSGYMIETAMASGITAMGGEAVLLGPLPTPGVAFVTTSMRADAGIMISASHNPYMDNGIKIFGKDGFKASDAIESLIEKLVAQPELMDAQLPKGYDIGRAQRIDEAHGRYIVFLKSKFPDELDLTSMRIALDCANGAGYKTAPMVFEELGAEVFSKAVFPNGRNINDHVGALFPEGVAELVKQTRADIGIALDGDADRVILSDETGAIIDGDVLIGLCALEMKNEGLLKGNTVVTTPMSNVGLERALKREGIQMVRVPVGDRNVVEALRKNHWNLGGEQSGHIIFLDSTTTGDGILAALKVLELMKRTGKKLSELAHGIELLPQALVNVKVAERKPLEHCLEYQKQLRAAEQVFQGRGRIFVRYSGTEAKVRVLIEGESLPENQHWAQVLAQAIVQDIAQSHGGTTT